LVAPNAIQRARTWIRESVVGHRAFELALYAGTHEPRIVPALNRVYTRAMFSRPRVAAGPSHAMFTVDYGVFRPKAHTSEWAIPLAHTAEALRRLRALIAKRGFHVHVPIEVRFVNRDNVWLSPCYGRDSCYIGVMAYMPYGRAPGHEAFFEAFNALMLELDGRPHWAKRFSPEAATLRTRYPRWADFAALRQMLDPGSVFANTYTERVLGPLPVPLESTLETSRDRTLSISP
jgi:L-gulonolactone oxidase